MLEIDASYGEGGGQLVRTAVALSAITGKPVHLENVRARRDKPGLAPQHLAAVRAVAALCDANCEGLALRAQAFSFLPGRLRAGDFRFDVGTAGSVTLVLQALLPALLRAPARSRVVVSGGTDVRAAPPLDYFRQVLLALLARMGARIQCRLLRRGYYPRGGGEVEIAVEPAELAPFTLDEPGRLRRIAGYAHVANLPEHIAQRMRDAAAAQLGSFHTPVAIETVRMMETEAIGQGGAIVCWAAREHSVLGAGRVAERGVRAEALGEAAGAELAAEIESGAALDAHAADQMLAHVALAGGHFTARAVSNHARTAMWLIEQFLPARFTVDELPHRSGMRVAIR